MRLIREFTGDLRYGARLLRRSPGFTSVAVASLALGIGGATAVFVLLNAIVLRTLPVPDARDLYLVRVATRQSHGELLSAPAFARARDELAGRAELFAATGVTRMQLWPAGSPAASRGVVQLVSGEYFGVLRQRAQLGRLLQPADTARVGADPVAVVSDEYWRRQLAASPTAMGQSITINGTSFTIVGVAQPGFFGTIVGVRDPDVWIPFTMQAVVNYAGNMSDAGGDDTKPWTPQPQVEWLNVFVRLPRSTTRESVAAKVSVILQREAEALLPSGASDRDRRDAAAQRAVLESAAAGLSTLRRDTSPALFVLLAMVAVLLAISCGNVAGLLLARAAGRERELSIRLSIGASRSRLVRQMLAESLLLGGAAGALGIAIAVWSREALLKLFVPGTTAIDLNTGLDWRVLGFAAGVSVLTGTACGVVPALRGTRVPMSDALKQSGRTVGVGGRHGLLAGRTLVAAQMAFCLLLLVVAGLFARSLQSLARTDVGFDRDRLLVAGLDVQGAGYSWPERLALYQRLLDRLQRVPGVESASLSVNGPLNHSAWRSGITVEGHATPPGERLVTNEEAIVGPYFHTVGLRLLEGRDFDAADHRADSRATIVNETMAKRFFPGQSAIGKRWGYGDTLDAHAFTIVGVVEDARYLDLHAAPPNMAYHPAEVDPEIAVGDLEIRTAVPPSALVQSVRDALTQAEPRLPVTEVVPLSDRIERGLSNDRLVAELTVGFGALALLLAALGLYGTVSYGINRRVSELGLRMALGADRGSVLRMIMREALLLVVAGAAVGLPLAFVAARSVGALLYGVGPIDLGSYLFGTTVLMVIAAIAAFVPAYRASRIEPMLAIGRP